MASPSHQSTCSTRTRRRGTAKSARSKSADAARTVAACVRAHRRALGGVDGGSFVVFLVRRASTFVVDDDHLYQRDGCTLRLGARGVVPGGVFRAGRTRRSCSTRPRGSPRRTSSTASRCRSGRRRRVSCIQWDTPRTCSTRPRAHSPRRSSGAIALVDAPRRRRRRAWRSRRQGRAATRGARDGSISPARTRWAPPPAAPPRVPPPRRRRLVRRRAWGWTTVGVSADLHTSAAGSKEAREREGTASRARNRSPMLARAMWRARGCAMLGREAPRAVGLRRPRPDS